MLDESEYAEALRLYREGIRAIKDYRERRNLPLDQVPAEEKMVALRSFYERVTGYTETNGNAIMHHRLSMYGKPCKRCGKPLRTPKAKLCGACMFSA